MTAAKPTLTSTDLHELLRRRYSVTVGNGPRYVLAPEVRNQAGFGGYQGPRLRSCDLIVLDSWQSGPVRLIGHELKCTRSDWLRELQDPDKAATFIPHVAEWWLVVSDAKIVREDELPAGWGLLLPAGGGLRACVRPTRKPQPPIAPDLLAPLLRSVHARMAREVERASALKPHTLQRMPMSDTHEWVPWPYNPAETDIAHPRNDLRRRR